MAGRKLTNEEIDNFQSQMGELVHYNTMGSIVKEAWESTMKHPAEETEVELESGDKISLQEMLDLWDSGEITPEMKEMMSNIINVPKISRKLDRITHGQFSAAVGKKLSSSLNKIKAEQERRRKLAKAEEERMAASEPQPVPVNMMPKPSPKPVETPKVEIQNERKSEEKSNRIDPSRIPRFRRSGGFSL